MKKLIGNTDVEDALRRLDRLTLEEAHMASVEPLRVSHSVEGRVICIGEGVQGVGDKVQEVDEGVHHVRDAVQDVGDEVQDVRDAVRDVGDGVQDVRDAVQDVGDGVEDVQQLVQGLYDKVDQVNRESSPNTISLTLQSSQIFPGIDLRERLRSWLSPPNPSINHNIACDAQHKGSAQWFFRGSIFGQWKSTVPFLWVHGKRASLLFPMPSVLTISNLIAGSGKSILWFVLPCHAPLSGTYMVIQCRNHSGYHDIARLWKCRHCILLFRLQRH